MKKFEQYCDKVSRLYPELHHIDYDGRVLSQSVTFQVTDDCNLACFVSGTKILMSDFSYKNIEDIKIGDTVLAFDEHTEKGKQLKLTPTKVTHTFIRHGYIRKVTTSDNEEIICTNEHPFLDGRRQWVRAEDINKSKKLTKFLGINDYAKSDVNNVDYMIGYVISSFLGDGHMFFYKHCDPVSKIKGIQSRLAVKDVEILDRIKQYLPILNIKFKTHPFEISHKEHLYVDAIFLNKENSLKLKKIIEDNWNINKSFNYYCGFLAGIIDTEGSLDKSGYIRIFNSNDNIIKQCEEALKALCFKYTFDAPKKAVNKTVQVLRICNSRNTTDILRLQLMIQNAVVRKGYKAYYGTSAFKRINVVESEELGEYTTVYNLETELHTYIANNFAVHNCTYCYQTHKGKRRMSFETAKKFIDMIISGEKGMYEYINPIKSPGLVVDFIGGEPFMEIELIDQICTYLMDRLIELRHPWAMRTMFSICSNGVLYRDEKVQKFLSKWANRLSFSVTVDGNKELHDACRVFHDGSPSYDLAIDAVTDWMSRGYYMGSKITIAPENISFLFDAVKHMVELGYDEINANCVYEKGWTPVHATVLYDQMKRISDYFLDGNFDFEHHMYCSLYNEKFFHPKDENDLQPWCFRAGTKILTPDGNKNIEDLHIGDKVISGSGKIQVVENVMKHYSEDTCVIKSTGVAPLYTTKDHPIFSKKLKGFNQKYYNPEFIKASELKKNDKIGLHKFKLGNVHVDPKLAYIIGRYIGDGWDSHGDYKICCSYDETNELAKALEEANISFTSCDYPTVKQFNILRENKELLSILSDAGHLAHGKKIPKVVFCWDEDSVKSLLNGLFDADGHYKQNEDTQCFNTVSPILVEDVMTLLKALGYYPTVYFNKRAGKHVIEGREVNVRDRYEVSFVLNPDKKKGFRTTYDKENDMLWSTVRSVEDAEPYEVYNLTVSEDHTFIANGVIVHNCGGVGNSMIACDPDGVIFPCIRYMESSLGGDQIPYSIGDVDNGIAYNDCTKCRIKCMAKVDRRTQSTDECFYCPIAEGCSNCSAYDYQINGTPDSRATFICIMHKARALANAYFWNKYYRKNNMKKRMKIHVPDSWALEIISQSELNMLKDLAKEDY